MKRGFPLPEEGGGNPFFIRDSFVSGGSNSSGVYIWPIDLNGKPL